MAMTDSKLSSDLFTPWSASPYYHLNPFMHSIMPTNLLVLGHIEKSKPGKPKTTPAKQKNKKPKLLRECLVLTQKIFWFSLGLLFFVLKWKKQKLCSVWFFEWIWSIKISKKNSCVFLRFCFYCYGLIRFQKQKTLEFFGFLRYWLVACMQKKKLIVFFCFWNQTKLGKTKKIYILSQNQTFSQKFVFFVFFGFAALLARLQNQHMMRLCVSACVY